MPAKITPLNNPRRILVIRNGGLGDFVLTLPALHFIRRAWPAAELELCTRPRWHALAKAANLAPRITDSESAFWTPLFAPEQTLPAELRAYLRQFDLVAIYGTDTGGELRRKVTAAGVKNFVAVPPRPRKNEHACTTWSGWIAPLAGTILPKPIPALILPQQTTHLTNPPTAAPFLLIHPGSGSPRKNWPLANFLALAESIRETTILQPVFLLGEAEENWPPDCCAPWPALRMPDLLYVCALLKNACYYVGNDSGITHLAAALGTPVTAIFGPTEPSVWGPRGRGVINILRAPSPHHHLADITPAEALASVNSSMPMNHV